MSRILAVVLRAGLTPDQEDSVLRAIAGWEGVRAATRVHPGARHPRLRRLATVELAEDQEVTPVLLRLAGVSQVEAARPAAERGPLFRSDR